MAVTVNGGAAALAGYLQPGAKVDLYANVTKAGGTASGTPCVELVEPDVEVLDVSDVVPPYRGSAAAGAASAAGSSTSVTSAAPSSTSAAAGARAVPGSVTALVAVPPAEVPRLVYFVDNEQQLYLVASDATTTPPSSDCYYLDLPGATPLAPQP